LEHVSQDDLPSVLDHPSGQDKHVCLPSSKVPGLHARVELHTPSALQSDAIQPLAIATEEDPPAAIVPASGLEQFGRPSFS
jgi:hypothetical protein